MSGPGRLKRPSRGPAEGYMEFPGRRSLLSLATSLSGLVRELFAGMPSRLLVTSVIGSTSSLMYIVFSFNKVLKAKQREIKGKKTRTGSNGEPYIIILTPYIEHFSPFGGT